VALPSAFYGSSNSLELKSDGHLQCGSTHDPHPNCAGTERVQTLAGIAGDTDGLSENVASHCASQVQLTAHANAYAERFVRTIKEGCLEQMIFFGEHSLRNTIRELLITIANEIIKDSTIGSSFQVTRRLQRRNLYERGDVLAEC
jgi:hypothetical protein